MPHISLAHHYWSLILEPDDTAVDATCGNGKDTVRLAQLVPKGRVIGLDIQEKALDKTRIFLEQSGLLEKVVLHQCSHQSFPLCVYEQPIKLIVYNLGYLPGGDKSLTTLTDSTLISVKLALELIVPGGAISITCYPGHKEGAKEQVALLSFVSSLDSSLWIVSHHQWINRPASPSLLLIEKRY